MHCLALECLLTRDVNNIGIGSDQSMNFVILICKSFEFSENYLSTFIFRSKKQEFMKSLYKLDFMQDFF